VNYPTSRFVRPSYIQEVWGTPFEGHKGLLNHSGIIEELHSSFGPDGIKHINFTQDGPRPFPAITAPVSEILDMTLKEGKTKEDLVEVLAVLAPMLDVDSPYPPPAWGESHEEPGNRYALLLGWNSAKVSFFLFFRVLP
jgi:hypothetical protein